MAIRVTHRGGRLRAKRVATHSGVLLSPTGRGPSIASMPNFRRRSRWQRRLVIGERVSHCCLSNGRALFGSRPLRLFRGLFWPAGGGHWLRSSGQRSVIGHCDGVAGRGGRAIGWCRKQPLRRRGGGAVAITAL